MKTTKSHPMLPKTLFFDVNETLLDLTPVRESVAEALDGKRELVPLWFQSLLHLSLVYSAGGKIKPFGQLAADALVSVAVNHKIELAIQDAEAAIRPILSCKPHDDVIPGLQTLRKAGYRLITLTNSSSSALQQQMKNSGLHNLFDEHLSVEEFGIYKPHRVVYEKAAKKLGTKSDSCVMIAAHDWDIMGAAWAGFQTVFISRGGGRYTHENPKPDLIASNIDAFSMAV